MLRWLDSYRRRWRFNCRPDRCRPIDRGDVMRTLFTIAILLGLAASAAAQTADHLYVMDCGHNSAKDQSRWSPGVNVGEPIELSDMCVLIKHREQWLLWDTGYPDRSTLSSRRWIWFPADPGLRWTEAGDRTARDRLPKRQAGAHRVHPGRLRYQALLSAKHQRHRQSRHSRPDDRNYQAALRADEPMVPSAGSAGA